MNETLLDMRRIIFQIEQVVNGMVVEEFTSDEKTILAVEYLLLKLSLSAQNALIASRYSNQGLPENIPWQEIASIRKWLNVYKQDISPNIIWKTIKEDLPNIKDGLRRLLRNEITEETPETSKFIRIKLSSMVNASLTAIYLGKELVPYLSGVTKLQEFIDRQKEEQESNQVVIKSITQNSPISVGISGALEATQLIQETVVPWRREHARVMAKLEEDQKRAEVELCRSEILEKHIAVSKERVSTESLRAEIKIQQEKYEQLRLQNEKLRLEIQKEKVQLAMDIIKKILPNSPETERLVKIVELLPIIDNIVSSDLELAGK